MVRRASDAADPRNAEEHAIRAFSRRSASIHLENDVIGLQMRRSSMTQAHISRLPVPPSGRHRPRRRTRSRTPSASRRCRLIARPTTRPARMRRRLRRPMPASCGSSRRKAASTESATGPRHRSRTSEAESLARPADRGSDASASRDGRGDLGASIRRVHDVADGRCGTMKTQWYFTGRMNVEPEPTGTSMICASQSPSPDATPAEAPSWARILGRYRDPSLRRSLVEIVNTAGP